MGLRMLGNNGLKPGWLLEFIHALKGVAIQKGFVIKKPWQVNE